MTNYDSFSSFYDAVMGDRSKTSRNIADLIKKFNPKAKNILELACGTGGILQYLIRDFKVSGLDLSPKMLKVAKKKLPKAKLYKLDMVNFSLAEKFDVILCLFDSINHLLDFKDWRTLFLNSYKHLKNDGIFIFDINTLLKLNLSLTDPTWVKKFDQNFMLMKVSQNGGVFTWNVKIFEHKKANLYRLHEENIHEASFTVPKIKKELESIFDSVKSLDLEGKKPSAKSRRLYFICKKAGSDHYKK